MTLYEKLSIISSIIGIIGGPLSVYFAWRAAKKAGEASYRADVLARRITGRSIDEKAGSHE